MRRRRAEAKAKTEVKGWVERSRIVIMVFEIRTYWVFALIYIWVDNTRVDSFDAIMTHELRQRNNDENITKASTQIEELTEEQMKQIVGGAGASSGFGMAFSDKVLYNYLLSLRTSWGELSIGLVVLWVLSWSCVFHLPSLQFKHCYLTSKNNTITFLFGVKSYQ